MKTILGLPTFVVFIFLILPAFFPTSTFGFMITLLWLGVTSYFVFRLGNALYRKLPDGHDLKLSRFNLYFFFIVVYSAILLIIFNGGYEINQDNFKDYGWLLLLIVPLHIFTMYCIFYLIWFLAKTMATIEFKKKVGFDTYAGNFFLIWFFFIGIWWIHPKIQKIFAIHS